jgi:hypothetical protein
MRGLVGMTIGRLIRRGVGVGISSSGSPLDCTTKTLPPTPVGLDGRLSVETPGRANCRTDGSMSIGAVPDGGWMAN